MVMNMTAPLPPMPPMLPGTDLSRAQQTVQPYGLTLADIWRRAERLSGQGISRSTFTKIMSGQRRPTLDMAMLVAQAMGIDLDELYRLLETVRPRRDEDTV